MPLYEYECAKHGRFEEFQHMSGEHTAVCPQCGADSRLLISVPTVIRMKEREQLQFGTKAPSQLIPSRVEGGLPSYVISEGALEQEEIDHIGLVQDEREIARQKQGKSDTAKAIGNLATVAKKQKQGNRFSTMKKIQGEGM